MCQLLFIGTTELLLIGGIALLLFGGKKLPEMMRGLGQGVREFKKGVNDVKDEIEGEALDESVSDGENQNNCESSNSEGKREDSNGQGK